MCANELSREIRTAVLAAAQEIGPASGVDTIILFGSVHRGKADRISDVDFAVVGTADACEHARKALGDAVEDRYVETIEVYPERDLEDMARWGDIRREALRTGERLWGTPGPEVQAVLDRPALRMPTREVGWRQKLQARRAAAALRDWGELWTEREEIDEYRTFAGQSSALAVDLFVKNALLYRGYHGAHEHDLEGLLAREGAAKEGPPVLVGTTHQEDMETLEACRDMVDGLTRVDRIAWDPAYDDLKLVASSVDAQTRRMGKLLVLMEREEALLRKYGPEEQPVDEGAGEESAGAKRAKEAAGPARGPA